MSSAKINELRGRMRELDINTVPVERVMYQIMDLEIIKYNGLLSDRIIKGDEVYDAIEVLINGYMWLYNKGFSLERAIIDKLTSDEDKAIWDTMLKNHEILNNFMRTNMDLKESLDI